MGNSTKRLEMYKILYIDSTTGIFGGGQISLLELLANLDRKKFIPLVVISKNKELEGKIKKLGIECRIIYMPSLKKINPFHFLTACWEILNYAYKKKVTLIHTNTSRSTIYAVLISKVLGIPLIWHVRIPHSDGLLDKFLARFASRIIIVSRIVKKRFDWLKSNKVELIYNGVDINKFSPTSVQNNLRREFNISNKDIVIGIIGRLSPEKGIEFSISAMRDIVKAYSHTKLLIVGRGNEKYRLSLKTGIDELNLCQHIIFAGFYEDIPRILGCIDIFCLPSLTEGFNRSLLEAMACGVPCVATNVGGNVEIVKDKSNGLLVPSEDSKAIASAIIYLLNDKERAKKMGLNARKLVKEKFSIEKNVEKIEELYLQIFE